MPPLGYRAKYVPLFKTEYVHLEDFVERVAAKTYGSSWRQTARNKGLRIKNAQSDIFSALRTEDISAAVWLTAQPCGKEKTEKVQFMVDPEFWLGCKDDVIERFVASPGHRVPDEYLYYWEHGNKLLLKEGYQPTSAAYHRVKICDAINLLESESFANSAYFLKRYARFRPVVTIEMVAYAWRMLAIQGNAINAEKLAGELEFYFENQGLKRPDLPSSKKFSMIARRVLDQYRRADLDSTTIVSLNPKFKNPGDSGRPAFDKSVAQARRKGEP